MLKFVAICNGVLTLALLGVVIGLWRHEEAPRSQEVVRARRLEIMDSAGKLRAVLDSDREAEPELVLLDKQGHKALLMTTNNLGYATVYFQSQSTEGKVSVGYLWGSDSIEPGVEDPLARWGVRLRGKDEAIKDLSLP